jgi:molybdopterin converting factor subunit 1
MVKIQVLFFASAREAAGDVSKIELELSEEEATTRGLRIKLAQMYPKLASLVEDEDNITLALNEEYVTSGQILSLKDGDTIALIPPISGG